MIVAGSFKEIDLVLVSQLDQFPPFFGTRNRRLFDNDVFTSQNSYLGMIEMQAVGTGDINNIDIRRQKIQHFSKNGRIFIVLHKTFSRSQSPRVDSCQLIVAC